MCANQLSGFCEWNGPPEKPPPDGQPDDDRHRRPGAVALLGGDGDELVPGAGDEVGELHLGDRPHAHDRGAGAAADDRRLGQRRVDHAPGAELLLEAVRDLEGAAVDADVLADHEDALVAPHLLAEPVGDRLQVGHLGHATCGGACRGLRASRRRPRSASTGRAAATRRRAASASFRSFLTLGRDLVLLLVGAARRCSRSQVRKRSIGSRFAHSSNISFGT